MRNGGTVMEETQKQMIDKVKAHLPVRWRGRQLGGTPRPAAAWRFGIVVGNRVLLSPTGKMPVVPVGAAIHALSHIYALSHIL